MHLGAQACEGIPRHAGWEPHSETQDGSVLSVKARHVGEIVVVLWAAQAQAS